MKKKVLVIRFSSLGDVILTTPVLPNIKKAWPDSEIWILTKKTFADVFSLNPHVSHMMVFDPSVDNYFDVCRKIRKERFDVIIDLQGSVRSWFIRVVASPSLVAVVEKKRWARMILVLLKRMHSSLEKSVRERNLDTLKVLDIPVSQVDTQVFFDGKSTSIDKWGLKKGYRTIGIAPGARHATKRWGVEKFADSIQRLAAFPDTQIILLGDKSDIPVSQDIEKLVDGSVINLTGKTTLKELIELFSQLSFLLTNDSGLMHLGEAMSVPLVAVFGPTVRGFGFAPYKQTSRVVEVINLNCRPCSLHGDEMCPLKHHNCMNDIDVSAVMFAASPLLGVSAESALNGC